MTQKNPLGMPLWHMMPLGEDKCLGCSVWRRHVYLLDDAGGKRGQECSVEKLQKTLLPGPHRACAREGGYGNLLKLVGWGLPHHSFIWGFLYTNSLIHHNPDILLY